MKNYVCIDIGGTEIKFGLVNEQGQIMCKEKMRTEAHQGGREILKKIMNIVETYQGKFEISGVGISTAGIVDTIKGAIYHAGPTIPEYTGIKFKETIESVFQIPCEVENDVNCAGLAEVVSGAAVGYRYGVMLTVGTGIGGCVLMDGNVFHGAKGCAGEIGYMNIQGGCFEQMGAASTLVKNVAKKKNQQESEWDGYRVFEGVRQGDLECTEAVDEMADILGKGIANLCYILNPEIVILGGGIMAQEEVLRPRIEAAMEKYLIPVIAKSTKVTFAKHKNDAGMLGAFYHLIQKQTG